MGDGLRRKPLDHRFWEHFFPLSIIFYFGTLGVIIILGLREVIGWQIGDGVLFSNEDLFPFEKSVFNYFWLVFQKTWFL